MDEFNFIILQNNLCMSLPRILLCELSPYFRNMPANKWSEEVYPISVDNFLEIAKYVTCFPHSLREDNVIEIFKISKNLQIVELQHESKIFLEKTMSVKNVIDRLGYGFKCNDFEIIGSCCHFIKQFEKDILLDSKLYTLSSNQLNILINGYHLFAGKEAMLMENMLFWQSVHVKHLENIRACKQTKEKYRYIFWKQMQLLPTHRMSATEFNQCKQHTLDLIRFFYTNSK